MSLVGAQLNRKLCAGSHLWAQCSCRHSAGITLA
ncbi:hypothetical protein PF002_g30681 [Phytophthora fragariae]|uniref:Uncharacterized protein n=1 Tax=Phytophthora fragariae TaxID=53985 RepID=A0A6A3VLL2_9STRA|nr:hypothetical protein PF006_g30088 [Phytophthora fragariae]KAE9168172.1 hypothetical protein PF002_g30681 [Phytophthora fragariae]